jgi:hypothetical protein
VRPLTQGEPKTSGFLDQKRGGLECPPEKSVCRKGTRIERRVCLRNPIPEVEHGFSRAVNNPRYPASGPGDRKNPGLKIETWAAHSAVEWIFVKLSIQRKNCFNPIHPLAFREVEFLLASYVISQEL